MTGNGPEAKQGSARGDAGSAAPYVNHLAISFDLSEVRIDFGQISDAGTAPQITSQLVTSPANFSRFHAQFCQTMRDYLGTFGSNGQSDCGASHESKEAS